MITQPYVNFIQPDAGGNVKPVSNGKIYIGNEGLDPKLSGNPIYYRDNEGLEKEISNPIYLNMTGVAVAGPNDSTIISPYTKKPISILIEDKNGNEVYSELAFVSSSLSPEDLKYYTDIVYKSSGSNSAVDNMILGEPIAVGIGQIVSTGLTSWKITSSQKGYPLNNGLYAIPLNGIWFQDYDIDTDGAVPCSSILNSIIADVHTYGINTSIRLGNGIFLFDSTVEYLSGTKIRGEGRSGDYKYVTEEDAAGTMIIVTDGVTAFQTNSKWCLYPEISGITFRAKTHGSSGYGAVANYSSGTHGIDVLYSIDGEFKNLAFESMDKSIFNRLGNGQESLRPQIKDVIAQDCNYVMKFIDGAADVHVTDIPICLHCNYMINCDTVDGFHFSDIRFFQSYNVSVSFVNSQFVNGSNIVLFETANTQMVIDNCDNVDISALTLSRAGWYHMGTPFPEKLALNVINSRNVKLNGIIERPSGKAINVDSSDLVNINMDVKAPFNTNGGASATTIFTSKNVEISGMYKIRGNAANAVEADNASRYEVTSKVTGDSFDKNVRFIETNAFQFKGTIENGTQIVDKGTSAALITEKVKVPSGKKLILGNIRYDNTNGLRPRIGSNFFLSIPTTDEGVEDSSQYVLLDNTSGGSVQDYTLTVQLYNNTGGVVNTGLDTITCYLKLLD